MTITIILFSIFLVSILGCLALVIWLYRLNSRKRLEGRLTKLVDAKSEMDEQPSGGLSTTSTPLSSRLGGVRAQLSSSLAFLASDGLRQKIATAYWPISDIEFVFIRIAASLAFLFLGWIIFNSILVGLGLGILFYLILGFILERSIARRRKKFQDQLVDFLVLIKGAILAGNSLVQALDLAVKEMPAPINEEFTRVLREMNFGIPLEDALNNLILRMQGDDLKIVTTAIIINNQMGGNLSTILEATIDTIRERIQLFGEIRALTSYPRYAAWFVTLLPFVIALYIKMMNPDFFDPVRTSLLAQIILILALLGIIIGNLVIRRIMKFRT